MVLGNGAGIVHKGAQFTPAYLFKGRDKALGKGIIKPMASSAYMLLKPQYGEKVGTEIEPEVFSLIAADGRKVISILRKP